MSTHNESDRHSEYDEAAVAAVTRFVVGFAGQAHGQQGCATAALLCLLGPPGIGKTKLVRGTVSKLGLKAHSCPGSELAGQYEGDSAAAFERHKKEAWRKAKQTGAPIGVLLIDDIDKSLLAGGKYGRGGTPNIQLLQSAFQSHADEVHGGALTDPVAIIATANCLDDLPLETRRSGRFEVHEMKSSLALKLRQARELAGDDRLARLLVQAMVLINPGAPIAHHASVIAKARAAGLMDRFASCGGDLKEFLSSKGEQGGSVTAGALLRVAFGG